ncbi:MAG: biotin--[acetyl-CoA-carboxylase] ligase, partial [Vicinamibacterales bacterium]
MIPEQFEVALAALRERRPDARLEVQWHATLPSTMDAASALANDGAAHGVVVVADEQTQGRGRRGTTWASPPETGLYCSFVARPAVNRTLSLITLAAGVAVRDGIRTATGLSTDLKWPNDLLVGKRKLAGILAEGHALGTAEQFIIIGAGVNVQPAAYP